MATETDDLKNRGVYVKGLSKGFKRCFFNVSVPHEYLAWLGTAPDERTIASLLDTLLQAAARGAPARHPQGAGGDRST